MGSFAVRIIETDTEQGSKAMCFDFLSHLRPLKGAKQ